MSKFIQNSQSNITQTKWISFTSEKFDVLDEKFFLPNLVKSKKNLFLFQNFFHFQNIIRKSLANDPYVHIVSNENHIFLDFPVSPSDIEVSRNSSLIHKINFDIFMIANNLPIVLKSFGNFGTVPLFPHTTIFAFQ